MQFPFLPEWATGHLTDGENAAFSGRVLYMAGIFRSPDFIVSAIPGTLLFFFLTPATHCYCS